MEGRLPRGIFVVFTDCSDPAHEQEFNDWYNNVHVPDVVGTGAFSCATRWVNTFGIKWKDVRPPPGHVQLPLYPKYLALYETDMDIDEAIAKLRSATPPQAGRLSPYLKGGKTFPFKRISDTYTGNHRVPAGRDPTNGLQFVFTAVPDQKDIPGFLKWYQDVHFRHLFETGTKGLIAATRYQNTDPNRGPTGPQFFALYELNGDPDAVFSELSTKMSKRREAGTTWRYPTMWVLYNQNYRRIF